MHSSGSVTSRRALLRSSGRLAVAVATAGVAGGVAGGLAGCVRIAAPEPAVIRRTPPPWDAPRDAVSYLEAAGLRGERLGAGGHVHVVRLQVSVAGRPVEVPANIGLDRVRAVQAPAHTHDAGGEVWLEGSTGDDVTLGQLFTLWGVRLDASCLGDACGSLAVLADGRPVADPAGLGLRSVRESVEVRA